ncbi:MAG: SDR family NAD(P)-dependent oxidoreductase [Actinomycetota bacterium]|nr:SDR family NAD(P)-dependent oxidoreductase [Actinomycetota bacterium]
MRPLTEQTILITGATDGLGKAVAADLAGRGATVLLHGRDDARGPDHHHRRPRSRPARRRPGIDPPTRR